MGGRGNDAKTEEFGDINRRSTSTSCGHCNTVIHDNLSTWHRDFWLLHAKSYISARTNEENPS